MIPARYRAAVAVCAASPGEPIESCLSALAADAAGAGDVAAFVLVDPAGGDDALARARRFAESSPLPVHVREAEPARGRPGAARREAMAWAAGHLVDAPHAVVLATEADSRVRPGWLAGVRRAVAAGADVVCGAVAPDPAERAEPASLPARRREAHYAMLLAQLRARLDPLPHDPWPNHLQASAASLAVRAPLLARLVAGPDAPFADGRALTARLELEDARIRHALDVRVVTGEAGRDDDPALEPVLHAAARADGRRRLRAAWEAGYARPRLALQLAVSMRRLARALQEPGFGRAWAQVERASRRLSRREPLTPARLPLEIARAERLLARVAPALAADPGLAAPRVGAVAP